MIDSRFDVSYPIGLPAILSETIRQSFVIVEVVVCAVTTAVNRVSNRSIENETIIFDLKKYLSFVLINFIKIIT